MNDYDEALELAEKNSSFLPQPERPTVLESDEGRKRVQDLVFSTLLKFMKEYRLGATYDSVPVVELIVGEDKRQDNIVEIADATSDIIVVTKGSQATFGFVEGYGVESYDMLAVKFFMVSMGQTVRDEPVFPSWLANPEKQHRSRLNRVNAVPPVTDVTDQEYALRGSLIAEELLELMVLGFGLDVSAVLENGETVKIENLKLFSTSSTSRRGNYSVVRGLFNEVNVLAKFVDLVHGIPTDDIFREVMRANMDKLWEDGKPRYRESDRKIMKPPHWTEPDIARVLKEAGYVSED